MKKLLIFFFILATLFAKGQGTNVFKYLELKNVDTVGLTRVGQFWYNPTAGKFTFHDASGYKHFGTIGSFWPTGGNASLTSDVTINSVNHNFSFLGSGSAQGLLLSYNSGTGKAYSNVISTFSDEASLVVANTTTGFTRTQITAKYDKISLSTGTAATSDLTERFSISTAGAFKFLPAVAPVVGQVPTATNTDGTWTWQTPSTGGTPGGSNTQFQFNNSSAFGGASGLTYNSGTSVVTFSQVPVFSTGIGSATATTQTISDNSTKVATTAYVEQYTQGPFSTVAPGYTNLSGAVGSIPYGDNTWLAVGASRKMLVSNGTRPVYSTETWAVPGTSGNVLTSDGTNWTSTVPVVTSVTNRQTASYVGVLSDAGKTIEMNVAGANTFTLQPHSSVPYPAYTIINVTQYGAGKVTITPGSAVNIRSSSGTLQTAGQYSVIVLYQTATFDEWYSWDGSQAVPFSGSGAITANTSITGAFTYAMSNKQYTFTETYTATGTPDYGFRNTGTITARATASDVLRGFVIDNTLVSAAATQTLTGLLVSPTFTDANSATQYLVRYQNAGTDVQTIQSNGLISTVSSAPNSTWTTTATATANTQSLASFTGNLTGRGGGNSGDNIYGYSFTPTMTTGTAGQNEIAFFVNAAFVGSPTLLTLLDLQTSGVSKFLVTSTGNLTLNGNITTTGGATLRNITAQSNSTGLLMNLPTGDNAGVSFLYTSGVAGNAAMKFANFIGGYSGSGTYTHILSNPSFSTATGTPTGIWLDWNPTSTSVVTTKYGILIRDVAWHSGFGTATPTAAIHIGAGTTAASTAPLKFTSGTLMTTAEAGAVEFLTDKAYFTITTAAARKELTLNDAALTSGQVPYVTTNGRLTSATGFTYDGNNVFDFGGATGINVTGNNMALGGANTTGVSNLTLYDGTLAGTVAGFSFNSIAGDPRVINSNGLAFAVGGSIKDHYTDVNNGTTVETDLYTFTTIANTLSTDGDKLYVKYIGTFNDVTATTQLKIYFGGNQIGDTGALTVSATGGWEANTTIIRTSSTTVRTSVSISTPGASTALYTKETDVTGLTLSNTNIVKITGQAGGASGGSSDITAKFGSIFFVPAAP